MFSKNIKAFFPKEEINSIFIRLLLWYYRIFGLKFGGLIITKTNECKINQNLKRFGFITTILIIISLNYLHLEYNKSEPANKIYSHGFKIIFYLISIVRLLKKIQFSLNFCYIQFRGFGLFKILVKYPIRRIRSKIVIANLFIIILILQLTAFYTNFVSTEEHLSLKNVSFMTFMIIYYSLSLSSIYFMTCGKIKFEIFVKNSFEVHFFKIFLILFLFNFKLNNFIFKNYIFFSDLFINE
jgi:hypothetical protein